MLDFNRDYYIDDVFETILTYGSVDKIWRAIEGDRPLHPILRDLLERGIKKRSEGLPYRNFEKGWLQKNDPKTYKKVCDTESEKVAAFRDLSNKIQEKMVAHIDEAVRRYAMSVLKSMKFRGIELGMMKKTDIAKCFNSRFNRSKTEFRQAHFLKEIHSRMSEGKLVKDCISPTEADQLWGLINKKEVKLA